MSGDRTEREGEEPFLWDRSGPVDEDVRDLERRLAPLRLDRELDLAALPDRTPRADDTGTEARGAGANVLPFWKGRGPLVVAGCLVAAAAAATLFLNRPSTETPIARAPDGPAGTGAPPPSVAVAPTPVTPDACESPGRATGMSYAVLSGAARCDGLTGPDAGTLTPGKWLETDAGTRVRIDVATIGQVEVAGGSRLRVLETSPTEQRLELSRGKIAAKIDAPPRLFFVNTPAATAVDLGCAYELEVDGKGAGKLRVTSGFVELERPTGGVWGQGARMSSLVPRGAECSIDPSRGPGTPVWTREPAEVKDAARRFDAAPDDAAAFEALLEGLGPRDTLTLVHLLDRVDGPRRARVLDRLEAIEAAPAGASRAHVLAGDPDALAAWREALRVRWFPK